MRSLYLRIWLTVVVALALFGAVSGWLVQRHLEQQRAVYEAAARDRIEAWADLLEHSLPPADAPRAQQAQALREWAQRLRLPIALDDARGERIGASDSFLRREIDNPRFVERLQSVRLEDGRTLRVPLPQMRPGPAPMARRAAAEGPPPGPPPPWGLLPRRMPEGVALALLLGVLFLAVAAGAYPVVRRLTRRLEALQVGVEDFGAGALGRRVDASGRDEVAAVAASFNRAATRIEALVRSHQSLLANASHELRSPLARLKMALAMFEEAVPADRPRLKQEIDADIAELDALVEEVLLSSRLDARDGLDQHETVDLLAVAAEEAARVQAAVGGESLHVTGDDRLLHRALRNLLENARRYGGSEIEVEVARRGDVAEASVSDRGAGVPEGYRERIFEAFFRLPGHAERAGGVGLGLALVRQIAERHGGSVRCDERAGGGSRFVLALPLATAAGAAGAQGGGAGAR
ncbi:MAG: HAMP domain-containing protein [Burkholderiales bacterium]|nr:HAMP domain-containing protein [Burkholderiales bacterium]